MTTYQISATISVEADNEEEAIQTFIEAVADGSVECTVQVGELRDLPSPTDPTDGHLLARGDRGIDPVDGHLR